MITEQRELYKGADYAAYYTEAGWLGSQVKVELRDKQRRPLISAFISA